MINCSFDAHSDIRVWQLTQYTVVLDADDSLISKRTHEYFSFVMAV